LRLKVVSFVVIAVNKESDSGFWAPGLMVLSLLIAGAAKPCLTDMALHLGSDMKSLIWELLIVQ